MKLHFQLKRRKTAMFAAILVGAATVAAAAQGLGDSKQVSHDPDYPPPYDNSKSDRALKAFDESHPKCRLWSDWRKLCSRTGPGGSTYCRLDRDHPVKASAPFCGKDESGYLNLASLSSTEQRSVRRFVIGYKVIRSQEDHGGQFAARTTKEPVYDPERPFSGRTIAQLEHPYCAVWQIVGVDDASSSLCAEDGRKGMQSCKTSQIRTKYLGTPVCVEKIKSRICDPSDQYEFRVISDLFDNIYNDSGVDQGRINSPIFGHTCPFRSRK